MVGRVTFYVCCIFFWLICQCQDTFSGDVVRISKQESNVLSLVCKNPTLVQKDHLDSDERKYLDENRQSYSTMLKGDFNGDGLADKAFLLTCAGGKDGQIVERLIVIMQQKQRRYRSYKLEEFNKFRDDVYIKAVSPGIVVEWETDRRVKIDHFGIERVFAGKSSGVFYWKDNRFRYLQTSD